MRLKKSESTQSAQPAQPDYEWEGSFDMKVSISEAINGIPSTRIVDDGDHYIMRDVVILSEYSKNIDPGTGKPRRYSKDTQAKACESFDGIQVNVNHPRRLANGQVDGAGRDVLMTLGKVSHPRIREVKQDGKKVTQTVGDLILVKGPASEHIVKLAKLDPKLAGMSLTGDCSGMKAEGEYANVEGLAPVTVDVVHRPATTKGFFEGMEENLGYYGPHDYKEYQDKSRTELEALCKEAAEEAGAATTLASKKPTMENHTIASIKHQRSSNLAKAAAAKALQDAAMDEFKEYSEKAETCSDASSVHRCLADHAKDKLSAKEVEAVMAKLAEEFGEQALYGLGQQARHDAGPPGDASMKKKKKPLEKPKPKLDLKTEPDEDEEVEDEGGGEDEDEDEVLDPDDVEDDVEGDEELPEGEGEGEGEGGDETALDQKTSDDEITRAADELTVAAKVAKTAESHVAAMFAHAKAAGLLYEHGNVVRATEHLDKTREHEARAEHLSQQQKPATRAPAPNPEGGVRTPSTMQTPRYESVEDEGEELSEENYKFHFKKAQFHQKMLNKPGADKKYHASRLEHHKEMYELKKGTLKGLPSVEDVEGEDTVDWLKELYSSRDRAKA